MRPDMKPWGFPDEEDRLMCRLFAISGSRWSVIAAHLPGRTDNETNNYYKNTKLKRKHEEGGLMVPMKKNLERDLRIVKNH